MNTKWIKTIARFLCQIIITAILIMIISVAWKGMYLLGIPKADDVEKVTISYPKLNDVPLEITDSNQIELALKLTGFLKYSLFDKADSSSEPSIMITYYLTNGKSCSVSANENTVWWKDKAHAIKQDEIFVTLTTSIFF